MQCCQTLMHLLQLSGQSAGADDFFPVLVYVILKANPPGLLSAVQVCVSRSALYIGDSVYVLGRIYACEGVSLYVFFVLVHVILNATLARPSPFDSLSHTECVAVGFLWGLGCTKSL